MKKIGILILGLCSLSLVGNFTQANGEYEYTSLDITANILNEGTINIKEDFTANFFVQKHGIIRDIPLNYSVEGYNFHIDVSNINVEGHKFATNKNNGKIEIKIGDANKTVVGEHKYPISYSTYGLIRNFSGMGYTELYWNIVGYDFDTDIRKIKAELILPKVYTGFTADDFLITTDGKTTSVKDFGGTVNWKNGGKITITYDKGLPAYQGITLAIKFPNDYFTFDHDKQAKLVGHINGSLSDVIGNFISRILGIGGVIFLIVFGLKKISKNNTNGIDRNSGALKGDFAKQFPVIVQYEPPKGLNSAEVGLLLHRGAKPKDILSLVYKRAAEGLIRFSVENEEGFLSKLTNSDALIISKNKDISEEAPEYEKDFFNSLIRGEKNKITKSSNLYDKLPRKALEKYGEKKGWLKGGDNRGSLITIGFIILCILISFAPLIGLFGFFALLFSAISESKMKETEEGAKLIAHILGYREFLAMCDENKLRLFLQQDPLYFDKILPYAVVFGLDTELIKKIEPIMQEMNIKSSWYNGDIHTMNVINSTISSVAWHSIPQYSSSGGFSGGSSFGGGFSFGGGGGGGGGRSW